MQAYGSAFDGPHWRENLLWITLCQLIPLVGQIVVDGYFYDVIELNSRRPGTPNPRFTFEKFTEHLVRGAWPFVIQFIMQMMLQVPMMILSYAVVIPLAIAMARMGPPTGPIVFGIGMGLYVIGAVIFAMLMGLVLFPILLRAGLAQDFRQAFNLRWILDYIRRAWFDTILVMLFMLCTGAPMVYLGFFMCGVGMFPAVTIVQMAGANLTWQLYNLYLARGGEPIPLKPSFTIAPVVAGDPSLEISTRPVPAV